MDSLLTIEEVSAFLRVKPGTLRTWVYRRQIPFLKVGEAIRFRRSDIEAWLDRQRRPEEIGLISPVLPAKRER